MYILGPERKRRAYGLREVTAVSAPVDAVASLRLVFGLFLPQFSVEKI